MQAKEKLKNNQKRKTKAVQPDVHFSPCMPDTHQIVSNQIWLLQCTIPSSQISACKSNGKHMKKWGEIRWLFSLDKKWIVAASVQTASDVKFMLISTSG
jgi:hypothetical protein